MQLTRVSKLFKPITLSIGMAAAFPLYSAVDDHSGIFSIITDPSMFESVKKADSENFKFYSSKLRFQSLYETWKKETRFLSSVQDIVNHEAFKAIVAMDTDAVPFIINEISNTPSTLVWALNYIYNRKISDNPNTTIPEACKLWVKELSR